MRSVFADHRILSLLANTNEQPAVVGGAAEHRRALRRDAAGVAPALQPQPRHRQAAG